ncbi:MAG TPA: glycosyltransferase family 1 protein [Bryobacteraceae bacterium]|nr:glycosyltransferase family 1 protein [Bryobacteraceae bacterium]
MRFSVDAHAIGRRLTGNEVYIRNLLESFAAIDAESEFIAYVSAGAAAAGVPRRFTCRTLSRNPWVRLGFDLPRLLRTDRPDLVHVQYTAPPSCPAPIVASVHDVSFLEHPEYFTAARGLQLRLTVKHTVKRAARVITSSEFSRNAIARFYGIDPERITVVPNAAAPLFRPLPHQESAAWVSRRFEIPTPYILTVGDLQSRKNQAGLIRAFAEMLRARPELPHHLVLAGQESWHAAVVHRAAACSGVAGRIHFTGFVSDDELVRLYNGCQVFVFPSFYEGFGLPVLEAMACGRPVACSNSSALYETADACALLFDPHSTGEMTRAMLDLALDAELRTRMGRLGLQRAALFSWRRTAEQTLAVYYEVASRRERTASPRVISAAAS